MGKIVETRVPIWRHGHAKVLDKLVCRIYIFMTRQQVANEDPGFPVFCACILLVFPVFCACIPRLGGLHYWSLPIGLIVLIWVSLGCCKE